MSEQSTENKVLFIFTSRKQVEKYSEVFKGKEFGKKTTFIHAYKTVGHNTGLGMMVNDFFISTRKIHSLFHLAQIWQRKSSSLYFRLMAYGSLGSRRQQKKYSSFLKYHERRKSFGVRLITKLLGNLVGVKILSAILYFFFYLESKKIVNSPFSVGNLVIFPYGGRISLELDFFIRYAKFCGAKTVGLQENWDNLSSKSFMCIQPSYFITWGLQSTLHLKEIQKYKGVIFEAGDPIISQFYSFSREQLNNQAEIETEFQSKTLRNPFILVIGSGDGIYDLQIIKTCLAYRSLEFESNHKPLDICYRPHPYSRISSEDESLIRNMPGLSVEIPTHNDHTARLSLISQARFVVALYSTVLLEASILNKICLIPSFVGSEFGYKTSEYAFDAAHYQGVSQFTNVFNLHSKDEFITFLKINTASMSVDYNRDALSWYCADVDFFTHLTEIIRKIRLT
jgi:hypothetical protein